MEVGHFKADCPKSEGTMKLRCFKCNSEEHVKAQCPLLKTHLSKDKDKVQKTKFGGRVLVDARENDGLADSELDLAKMSENLRALLAFCNKGKAKEDVVSKSTTIVDDCSEGLEAYSNVDEIGMEGFCLMAGSTRQENACGDVSSLSKGCGDALVVSLGKFLKAGQSYYFSRR